MNRLFCTFLVLTTAVCAQHRVDPRNIYHRVITVVPYVGQGSAADPKRPQYAPLPTAVTGPIQATAPVTIGPTSVPATPIIIGYMHVPSDDGKFALVEYVARDMAAFQTIMSDTSITVFVKGKDSKATIEAALQKYKKNFNLDSFGVVIP